MKILTKDGVIRIKAETDIESSFLCLWEAEARRLLEHEGVDMDVLNPLLDIQSYIEDEAKS